MRMGLMVFCAALGLISGAAWGQTIRLKSLVTVELHQDVRLGDVATVSAPDKREAEGLANTVIVAGIDKPMQVKVEAVLMALMAQHGAGAGGGLGSNLQVSGAAACAIEIGMNEKAAAMGTENVEQAQTLVKMPVKTNINRSETGLLKDNSAISGNKSTAGGGTVRVGDGMPAMGGGAETLRQTIMKRLLADMGVAEEDVQVDFNTTSPLVDGAVGAGQRWLVRPLTKTPLGTVQFEAQLAEGTKVLQRLNVQTEVKRHQKVVVTTGRLARGDVVTAEMVKLQDVWMDRNVPTLFAAEKDVIGLEAQRDLDAGSQADGRDFRPMLMAHKGDLITVLYVAGPLEVQMRGRAAADAKFHEPIDVRNESTGEKYTAVMVKKGVGVVGAMTGEQERKLVIGN